MGVEIQLFEVGVCRSDLLVCLWGWMKREIYKQLYLHTHWKLDTCIY